MSITFDTTVFCDPQGEAAARVYVVAAPTVPMPDEELAELRLAGRIVGPTCMYSSTLQASIPFKHRGLTRWSDRTAIVGEAVVPDPCYWSSELPFLYRAVGEVMGPGTSPSAFGFDQTFGLRSVGTVGKRLTFNGRIWVPRIVRRRGVDPSCTLAEWRRTDTVMAVTTLDETLLNEADETGVAVIVYLGDGKSLAIPQLRKLSVHPSVVMAHIEQNNVLGEEWRSSARGIVLARWYDREVENVGRDATDLLVLRVYEDGWPWEGQADTWPNHSNYPILPLLPLPKAMSLVDARRRCDDLQRMLAGKYDAAGYIV